MAEKEVPVVEEKEVVPVEELCRWHDDGGRPGPDHYE